MLQLQTPLAVCCNRIEMLFDRPDLNEDIANELIKVHRSLNGLIRLNKTLLLLSKIENGQFPKTSKVDMNTLASESIQLYQEIHAHKNIEVSVTGDQRFLLDIDEQLASVLVGNLVKNAFRYTPQNGFVHLSFTDSGFSVSNTGDVPLDGDKVFRRFYQPSGRTEGATGLGLALAYSVCVNNGLDITYDFIDGMHVFAVNSVSFQNHV